MTYKEARVYLDEMSKYGSVLGLDTIRNLLKRLGNPERDLSFIHIAGTNGKGSVLAYISNILSEAGYRTGRYISPTVLSYLERIQVDGRWIEEQEFAEVIGEVRKAAVSMEADGEAGPTVFEAETAAAFLYFKKRECDIVVLETGLGGCLDATNVVERTVAAVFTSISRDHMEFLGDTLEEIARQKAGIMKKGCVAVTAEQQPEAMTVLKEKAQRLDCPLYVADIRQAEVEAEGFEGLRLSFGRWKNIEIPLAGSFQIINSVTALETVEALKDAGYGISEAAVRRGFSKTVWLGRFTCISKSPLFIVDGAHNEAAALRLRESLLEYFPGKQLVFVMGVFKDKEYKRIAEIMGPLAERIYTVSLPDQKRTLKADALKEELRPYCRLTEAADTVPEAVEKALGAVSQDGVAVAFGSLSYLGQVMELVAAGAVEGAAEPFCFATNGPINEEGPTAVKRGRKE